MVGAQDIFLNPILLGEWILHNLLLTNLRREMWVRFLLVVGWILKSANIRAELSYFKIVTYKKVVGLFKNPLMVGWFGSILKSMDSFAQFVWFVRGHNSFVR